MTTEDHSVIPAIALAFAADKCSFDKSTGLDVEVQFQTWPASIQVDWADQ